MMPELTRLSLTDFRSYTQLDFTPDAPLCVFTGANGAGKTNLLEAVSMLVPGRGLRGARVSELARRGDAASGTWTVHARLGAGAAALRIGTGTAEPGTERRGFRLDDEKPRNSAEIAAKLAAVWLTPQMDRLFTESAGGRRRFLDRLVIALEPTHAREMAGFEAASAQRNRLLAEAAAPDPLWLDGLEDAMARHAVAATASRAALIARLNAAQSNDAAFPAVSLALDCAIAARLAGAPAAPVEDWLRGFYAVSRAEDTQSRGPKAGPARADVLISDAASGRPAGLSSTGEQKSMLLGIILSHAALIAAARGAPPILLLDEPLVHLDDSRRRAFFDVLAQQRLTAWSTGTDIEPFAPFREAACYKVGEGRISGP